jgi:hypothetical protein
MQGNLRGFQVSLGAKKKICMSAVNWNVILLIVKLSTSFSCTFNDLGGISVFTVTQNFLFSHTEPRTFRFFLFVLFSICLLPFLFVVVTAVKLFSGVSKAENKPLCVYVEEIRALIGKSVHRRLVVVCTIIICTGNFIYCWAGVVPKKSFRAVNKERKTAISEW